MNENQELIRAAKNGYAALEVVRKALGIDPNGIISQGDFDKIVNAQVILASVIEKAEKV